MSSVTVVGSLMLCASLVTVAGCRTTDAGNNLPNGTPGLPEECSLPPGDSVQSMEITTDGPIELDEGESAFIAFDLELNRPATGSGILCMELKDSELVRGLPMAIGIQIIQPGMQSYSSARAFSVECVNNEIRGVTNAIVRAIMGNSVDLQDTTGERSTRVRIQELRGLQTVGGAVVGVTGERTGRIRVRCNR